MKQFLAFVRKEFYHIFRDRRTMMILFMMPIMQMLLFGFALTTEVKNTHMAVLDLSKDLSTERIIEQLNANNYFTLTRYLHSWEEIESTFQEGNASLVVVFEENFHNNLLHGGEGSIQLLADATDPNQAIAFTNYAVQVIAQYGQELTNQQQAPLQIVPTIRMLYNPQMKGAYNFVPGVMGLILMLICAMMTSVSIVREKERGTMEILLSSPIKPIYIILSKVTPYFALAIVDLAVILLLSRFILHVPLAGNLFLLVAIALIFILSALSLGILISNLVTTQVAAMLISGMGLMLPTIILSGLIFPIESMPKVLQIVSAFLPARWFIQAVRKIMIQGVDGIYVLKEFLILSSMVLLLLAISLKQFTIRLKK
ncbi:MAG: ABC transporter permease [Phocaeicola sp.]